MRTAIFFATREGQTRRIAARVADDLRERGVQTDIFDVREAREIDFSRYATAYQRISAGFGFSKIGRERLAFRTESATHVRWRRGVGAYVDVTGARTATSCFVWAPRSSP